MKKILQVFSSLNIGGAESRMMDVYRSIDKNFCTFDFVYMMENENFFELEIRSLGGNVFRVDSPRKCGFLQHIKQLRLCMKARNYDAVHSHTLHHCGIVMFSAWLENIPVRISHSRSTNTRHKNFINKLFLLIGKVLIHFFATARLANSQEAGKFLFGSDTFEVIPNAIDIVKYQSTTPELTLNLKKSLNVPERSFVIGKIGRFEMMKNHVFTLKWFAHYKNLHKEAFLFLIGDGSLRPQIEKLAHDLNIFESVLFAGVRDDVQNIIHAFDVLLLPSLFEGLGGVVLEAQAAGVKSVISDNVPLAVDMGLGLVTRVSLEAPFEVWDRAVETNYSKPSNTEIKSAFEKNKLTLDYEISKLLKVYEGS